jgi:hypothetical protein
MLKTWYERLVKAYEDGRYLNMILSILGIIIFILAAIVATVFIVYYFGVYLVMAGVVIGAIIGFMQDRKKKATVVSEQLTKEEFERIKVKARQYHHLLLPIMTDFIRALCSIFAIEVPKSDSDILPKRRWTIGANRLILLHYAVNKTGDCDIEAMMQILQQKIFQKLASGEISFLAPRLINWNGDLYPSICVESVRDNGTHLEITVVFNSIDYIQTMNAREKANLRAAASATASVEDDQF